MLHVDPRSWRIGWIHSLAGTHTTYLTPTVVGGRRPLPSEICTQSDPPLPKNADLDTFPLITSQPLEMGKKVQLWQIGS